MVTPTTTPTPSYDTALASRLFELENEAMADLVGEFARIARLKPSDQREALREVQTKAQTAARGKLDAEMASKATEAREAKAKADAAKAALAEVVKSYDGFKLVARPGFEAAWLAVKDECGKLNDVASLTYSVMQKGDGSGWDIPTLVIKPKTKLPGGTRQATSTNGNGHSRRGVPVNVSKGGTSTQYPSRAAAYKAIIGNAENKQLPAPRIDKALGDMGYTVAIAT